MAVERFADRALYAWRVFLLSIAGVFVFLRVVSRASLRGRRATSADYRPIASDFDGAMIDGCTAAEATRIRPSRMSTALAFLADLPSYVSEINRPARRRVPRPPQFRDEIADINGIRMALTIGPHSDGRERTAVIFVPGLFNSRHQNVMIRTAQSAFAEGFDVVIPDLRGFGETGRLNAAPPSGTWKEGSDVAALATWLRERLAPRAVLVTGFSYGGSVALAAAAKAELGAIDGCVAFCPFGDARSMIERLSTLPPLLDPFAGFQHFFEFLLRRLCRARNDGACRTFAEHFEHHIAGTYGVTAAALYELSSPIEELSRIAVPTTVVYALDDPVIPLSDALSLVRRAHTNPSIRVVFLRHGGHYGRAMVKFNGLKLS
jgi:pimeloyl-ACP methyl ester carboxylesterase